MTIIPVPPETSKAIIEEGIALVKTFLGPAAKEVGEIGGDYVRFVRFERQVKALRKALKIARDSGVHPKAVNMRVLFPLLDAVGVEDSDDMGERWASLLASAADPKNQSALEASFVEILKQLAPPHAFVLDVFYEQVERHKLPPEQWEDHGFILSILKDYLSKDVPQFDVAIDNLLRLHLVKYPTAKLGIANGNDVRIQITSSDILCPTKLGQAFVSACGHGRMWRTTSYGVPGNSIENIYWTKGESLQLWSQAQEMIWKRNQADKMK